MNNISPVQERRSAMRGLHLFAAGGIVFLLVAAATGLAIVGPDQSGNASVESTTTL